MSLTVRDNRVSIILIVSITVLLIAPILANGYAKEIKLSDCKCKWHKSELVVWINNTSEVKYTRIVTDAINEWHDNFKELSYKIHTIPPDNYDIEITIHKAYGKAVGLPRDTAAITSNEREPNSNRLVSVTIDVPTYYRSLYGSTIKIKDVVFYNMILHEFGHAIGLGHATDNRMKPLDPMYHSLRLNEEARKVSELDVTTLASLYKE
jgi:hypothetical protein